MMRRSAGKAYTAFQGGLRSLDFSGQHRSRYRVGVIRPMRHPLRVFHERQPFLSSKFNPKWNTKPFVFHLDFPTENGGVNNRQHVRAEEVGSVGGFVRKEQVAGQQGAALSAFHAAIGAQNGLTALHKLGKRSGCRLKNRTETSCGEDSMNRQRTQRACFSRMGL